MTHATYTGYEPYERSMTGPAGVSFAYEVPVEVLDFQHDRHGILGVLLRQVNTNLRWWVFGDELEGIEVSAR